MATSDQQQLGAFEEHLLTELKTVIATRTADGPAPAARPRSRRRLVLAGVALAVVGAAAAVVLPGLRTSAAYAVQRDPDGSIRVSIFDYRDPQGLQERIEAFGVKAAVDYLPAGMACKEPRADFVPPDRMPLAMVDFSPLENNGTSFKVHPEYIGPDQTFVWTVQMSQRGADHIQRFAIRLANGPVAPCVRVPGDIIPGR